MVTFVRGLWTRMNDRLGLLIDEYEEERLPVASLQPVADELRALAIHEGLETGLRDELTSMATFLEAASHRGVDVWICL